MNATAERNKVIWRFSDGRAGHDSQSTGLISALADRVACESYDVNVPFSCACYGWSLLKKLPHLAHLPDPDLLIGAGHASHIPMLLARYVRGGQTLVLMNPSLPTRIFDLCLIPEHDKVKRDDNIITTMGPLNKLHPASQLSEDHGLILIGGESKHFYWDEQQLQQQLLQILDKDGLDWTITDSPRTPKTTSALLQTLNKDNVSYLPFAEKGGPNLQTLLQKAATVWVSEDSMSMIYEALASGASVGILQIPSKNNDRLAKIAQSLATKQLLTLFEDWLSGQALTPPVNIISESARCADELIERFQWHRKQTA